MKHCYRGVDDCPQVRLFGKQLLLGNGVTTTELTGFIVAASTQSFEVIAKRGALILTLAKSESVAMLDHATARLGTV